MKAVTLALYAIIVSVTLTVIGVGAASAGDHSGNDNKVWVCHPVNGKGETGTGWDLIDPAHASSHIDLDTGLPKHESQDGRVDVYAVDGQCPGDGTSPSVAPSPSETPSSSPSTTSPSPSATPSPSESGTVSSSPSPSVTVNVNPPHVPVSQPTTTMTGGGDPVVLTETSLSPGKTVTVRHHRSGKTTKVVHVLPTTGVVEEGF